MERKLALELVELAIDKNPAGWDLIDKHGPKYFYKYQYFDLEGYAIDNLKKDAIWYSNPKTFNDPYDSQYSVNSEALVKTAFNNQLSRISEIPGISKSELEQIQSAENPFVVFLEIISSPCHPLSSKLDIFKVRWQQGAERIINDNSQILVSCFSETMESILMWSHYSHHHSGFCIEYEWDNRKTEFFPIIYSDMLEQISVIDVKPMFIGILTKSRVWEYEKECRIFLFKDQLDSNNQVSFQRPKAVYLGTKISLENKNTILGIAKEKSITVFQMEMSKTEFKLEPKLIYQP